MKRNAFNLSVILFLGLFSGMLGSCSHQGNDDNPSPGGNPPAAGTWHVSYFFDKQDETANYNGYAFEFGSSSITATKGGQTWSGTWTAGADDSANKFLIDFNGTLPSALSDLEEDWRIIEQTDDFMHFEHTSGGNGDTDVLKFTRN